MGFLTCGKHTDKFPWQDYKLRLNFRYLNDIRFFLFVPRIIEWRIAADPVDGMERGRSSRRIETMLNNIENEIWWTILIVTILFVYENGPPLKAVFMCFENRDELLAQRLISGFKQKSTESVETS